MAPNLQLWTPGACSQEHGAQSELLSKCGRARSAPPMPMSSHATWCFHHQDAHGDEVPRGPKLGCRSAAESSYDKVTAEIACNVFNCTGFEGRPVSKRCPGQFSSESGVPFARSYIAANFHMKGVCDIEHNLRRNIGQGLTAENEQQFSEEKELSLKRSLSSLSVRDVRPEMPDFLCDLACLGIECRRLTFASMSYRDSQKISAKGDAASTIETSSLLSNQRLTPVLSRPRRVKVHRRASRNRPDSDWLDSLNSLNINTRRLVVAYSSRAQLPQLSRPRVEDSLENSSIEFFTPQDCKSVGAPCSTIDEDDVIVTECQANDCSQRIVIPKLERHLLEAARKDNGAPCSSSSTVGSAEGSSIDEFSD